MKSRGFTIVELIVIITVMGILLVMGVVNLEGAQSNGRDSERKADIESLTAHLETFYESGSDDIISIGEYPSVDPTNSLIGQEVTFLRDLDIKSITAPNQSSSSLIAATNNTQTTAGVTPQPTIDQYVYQPIASDGSLCDSDTTEECRKFNLYYQLETDSTVYMVTSKNQ